MASALMSYPWELPLAMNPAILLIDDEENDVTFTTIALEKAGVTCPVHVAKNGREALDYLSGHGKFADRDRYPLPYLVLLDLKLPFVIDTACSGAYVGAGCALWNSTSTRDDGLPPPGRAAPRRSSC